VVIGEEVGMRMKVGEWISSWLCNEIGVEMDPMEKNKGQSNLKTNFKSTVLKQIQSDIYSLSFLIRYINIHILHKLHV